ncbi:beta galactosidase jelly roll domain-containing protein [Neisseriaceae bacterium TC5R-5]|nr:beta galactosidase jelly roll domain-containing protein [Neisseriaceae bacterium TC5R-5]
MPNTTIDPFAHLHDENYHQQYQQPLLQSEGLICTDGRTTRSLNGEWFCTLDPFDEGLRQKWFQHDQQAAEHWLVPRDYEVEAGKRVPVPGCLNLYDERWTYYEGVSWFSCDFEHDLVAEERVFLSIGAAAYQARIFLNGHFLGRHLGASTPFCVELSYLQNGSNRLQIQVDNSRHPQHVPMQHIDWFNYGGLYRDICLLTLPPVFISDFNAGLLPDSQFAYLRFELRLSEQLNGVAQLEIAELGLQFDLPISQGYGVLHVGAKPVLWSPEQPKLYTINARFGTDRVTERIGFREISVEGENILLNGQSIWLRGVCVHEEYPMLGKAANEATIRQMLADARALGCNFLRLSHYPHHELVARIADELGILLWEEIPVYWAIDFSSPETLADAENQLCELIQRDRNRASVIIWGIGNENADSDARYQFMSRLAHAAREADTSRLISAACLINREKFMIEDRLANHLDIIGINEYFGWYEPDFADLTRLLQQSSPGKPVIISEVGADALAGLRGETRQLFTEDCQADIYRQQIKHLRQSSYIRGICPWVLYDFRSERRQTRFQQGYNRKGLIAADHQTRKLAFHVLADFYHSLDHDQESL